MLIRYTESNNSCEDHQNVTPPEMMLSSSIAGNIISGRVTLWRSASADIASSFGTDVQHLHTIKDINWSIKL